MIFPVHFRRKIYSPPEGYGDQKRQQLSGPRKWLRKYSIVSLHFAVECRGDYNTPWPTHCCPLVICSATNIEPSCVSSRLRHLLRHHHKQRYCLYSATSTSCCVHSYCLYSVRNAAWVLMWWYYACRTHLRYGALLSSSCCAATVCTGGSYLCAGTRDRGVIDHCVAFPNLPRVCAGLIILHFGECDMIWKYYWRIMLAWIFVSP